PGLARYIVCQGHSRNAAINTTLAHGTGSRAAGTSLRMASPAASRYGVDNNNNNHSAIAAVFAESRATAAASPWAAPAAPIAGFYKRLNRASRRR
ncbi:hypothetical protein E4U16_008175, partial [Claviceps sp. LM84 group G4]